MKLLTKQILRLLPPLGSTDDTPSAEVKVPLKLFNPGGVGTWYITEYDPTTDMAFGYADILCGELGYISIKELREFRGHFGLGIERDMHWDSNTTLNNVMSKAIA